MSVTTSSNADPPPLLFGQRSPSPPAFSSFSQNSPQSPRSPRSPRFPPPTLPDHSDMDNARPQPPAPPPAHSDSEDSDMDGTEESVEAFMVGTNHSSSTPARHHAADQAESSASGGANRNGAGTAPSAAPVPDFVAEQDAMDTTPDLPAPVTFAQPPPSQALQFGMPAQQPPPPPPPPPPGDRLSRVNSHGSSIDTGGDVDDRPRSPPEPPPPVIPPAHQSAPGSPRDEDAIVEHEDLSDDEDAMPRWREIREDHSAPDEHELRDIEAMGEVSAHDHEHWEEKTFVDLDDPEYTPGPSGRLDWTVSNYNGTRECPNKELVMKSPVFNVGGYDWQMKFYPKGNDSDFLSVYVECLTVAEKKEGSVEDKAVPKAEKDPQDGKCQQSPTAAAPLEYQQAPLPLLTDKPIPKRPSVAAQVAVVLYSPSEPRVNFYRSCSHRFCPDSPDWGWTRFHGPHYEIHYRHRNQRQALLRNDTLAFRTYIRVIDDQTGCLWEHHSRDNRWDSFAMTGLQGLADTEYNAYDGSTIAAISSWMLLKPFRQFLYELELPDPVKEARAKPKPLLAALQRTLYRLRTDVQPGCGAVELGEVAEALDWYGADSCFSKLDVIEIWEILRAKIEFELAGTPSKDKFVELFGPERDRMTNIPTYRAPVKDCADIQTAVDKAVDLVHPTAPLPKILHVELERQEFNKENRTMKKIADKVKILDKITINRTSYILYGFIAHKDSLQSGSYYSVLRPRGPGGKWYAFNDSKDENRVICLTKKQAIEKHEGGGSDKSAVAYILMYIRQDIVPKQFSKDEPAWDVPEWLKSESAPVDAPNGTREEPYEYQIIDSGAFLHNEGPGTIDPSDPKWERSSYMNTTELSPSATTKEIREALALKYNAKDPRQIKFWFLDHANGNSHRPVMRSSGNIESMGGGSERDPGWTVKTAAENWPERRIWMDMVAFESLPELPNPIEPQANGISEGDNSNNAEPVHEDSPMSDADDGGQQADDQMDLVISEGLTAQAARLQHLLDAEHDPHRTQEQAAHAAAAARLHQAFNGHPAATLDDTGNDADMGDSAGPEHTMPPPPPPPPPVDLVTPPLQSMTDNVVVITNSDLNPFDFAIAPPAPNLVTSLDDIFFFLKVFDAETQTLKAHSTVIAKKSDRMDHTILDALKQPHDSPIDIYEEESSSATKIQRGGSLTFSQTNIHSTAILIAQKPLTDEQRSSLADRALFADPAPYLQHATALRFATPQELTGHFTLDYFSSEHHIGMLVRGRPHGHGRRVYFDGGEYVGGFRLGGRHGHGRLTYPNGDVYDGQWANDVPDGSGSFVEAATGNAYHGGWKAGKKFGEGVTHWRNAQEMERLCRICWEEGADAAFYDCGHVVACLACARRVDACPVCRRRVLSAMKLFFGN